MRRLLKILGVASLVASTGIYAVYAWVDRALARLKW